MEAGRTRTPSRQRATLVNARSRETRLALIRAAVGLWGEGDFDEAYESSTVADIARAAGVSKGTFYFHFANKEAILLDMSSATTRAMIDQAEAAAGQDVPLAVLSDRMMSAMARRVVRAPKSATLRAGALGLAGRAEGTLAGPRLAVAFEALLRHGTETGELSADTDVEERAAMLAAVTMGAITRWAAADHSPTWLDETLRDWVSVVLRGLGASDTRY